MARLGEECTAVPCNEKAMLPKEHQSSRLSLGLDLINNRSLFILFSQYNVISQEWQNKTSAKVL